MMIVVVLVLPGVTILDDGLLTNQYPPNNELTSMLKTRDEQDSKIEYSHELRIPHD